MGQVPWSPLVQVDEQFAVQYSLGVKAGDEFIGQHPIPASPAVHPKYGAILCRLINPGIIPNGAWKCTYAWTPDQDALVQRLHDDPAGALAAMPAPDCNGQFAYDFSARTFSCVWDPSVRPRNSWVPDNYYWAFSSAVHMQALADGAMWFCTIDAQEDAWFRQVCYLKAGQTISYAKPDVPAYVFAISPTNAEPATINGTLVAANTAMLVRSDTLTIQSTDDSTCIMTKELRGVPANI